MTEAQRKAFIANPENNCYLDGDKVIQVRYRVRVVQGWGDNWANVDVQLPSYSPAYSAPTYVSNNIGSVVPKGKITTLVSDYGGYSTTGTFIGSLNPSLLTPTTGQFNASGINNVSGFLGAHEGKCYAIPLALAHRRNQGMYHNVYNQNGTKLASDGLDCFKTAISFTSTMDCFDPAKLLTNSGSIASAVSGRPD